MCLNVYVSYILNTHADVIQHVKSLVAKLVIVALFKVGILVINMLPVHLPDPVTRLKLFAPSTFHRLSPIGDAT